MSYPSTTLALQPAGFPGLRVLVLAADLHDLPHAQARRLAGQLRSSAEYAVIEAPAPGTGPDSLALAEYCGAALLTMEIRTTKRPDIEDSIRRLTRLGTSVVGVAALPRLRLPARAFQTPERAFRPDPSGCAKPQPVAPAKDGEDDPAMQAVHADAADGLSGN